MNKIKAFIDSLTQGKGNPKVFTILLVSAALVTLLRLLAPVEMNWDEAIQLEAAHRLVKGLGLTSTFFPPPFNPVQIPTTINQAPTPQFLTWWPPGFSLLVAGLLAVGIPLALALKIIYSVTTLLGWVGWGSLASIFLSSPIKLGSLVFPVQYVLAAVLPLFYTPGWQGTDIFLWTGLPFIVILLFNSALKDSGTLKYAIAAGLLFGFLMSIRFASLFIALTAFLLLFQVYSPHLTTFIKHYCIFFFSSLAFILPVFVYTKLANWYNGVTKLQEINLREPYSGFFSTISQILKSASAISEISGLPIQPSLAYRVESKPSVYLIGAFFLFFAVLLPLLVLTRDRKLSLEEKKRDISLAVSFIPLSVVLLLLVCNFAGDYDFLGTPRYYTPAVIPTILITYEFAAQHTRRAYQLIKLAFAAFIIYFLAYNLLLRNSIWAEGARVRVGKSILSSYLMYRKDYQYPSNKVITLVDETSVALRDLQKDYPEAIFFVQEYAFYVYDGHEGLRTIPTPEGGFWKEANVDKPVKIFWVVARSCPGICTDHSSEPIEELSSLPSPQTVYESRQEKTKILATELPSGYKF